MFGTCIVLVFKGINLGVHNSVKRVRAMDYKGKSVLVLGLARSGEAVARLLHRLGAIVTVNDGSDSEILRNQTESLERLGIHVILGEHPLILLDDCDLIVKNPGIKYDRPILVEALKRQIPIITEVEVAYAFTKAPIIGITGSNGKTTTTMLVDDMLQQSHIAHVVGGNVGTPLSDVAVNLDDTTWVVSELSSFQLKGTQKFKPRISAMINVYPTHLDYHHTMEDYIASKQRLFANQEHSDIAILNVDHPIIEAMQKEIRARVWKVSMKHEVYPGVFVLGGNLVAKLTAEASPEPIIAISDIFLRGEHNVENALVASAIALCAGASIDAIRFTLENFKGVEHRLEFVREVGGVTYFNNSKATNPQATLRALMSFHEPVVCILGGLERNDDLQTLLKPLQDHVKAVVTLGESRQRMADLAKVAGISSVTMVDTIEDAVVQATKEATIGDVVLLAPAAASWDMFASFEERGRIFKEAVHRL